MSCRHGCRTAAAELAASVDNFINQLSQPAAALILRPEHLLRMAPQFYMHTLEGTCGYSLPDYHLVLPKSTSPKMIDLCRQGTVVVIRPQLNNATVRKTIDSAWEARDCRKRGQFCSFVNGKGNRSLRGGGAVSVSSRHHQKRDRR